MRAKGALSQCSNDAAVERPRRARFQAFGDELAQVRPIAPHQVAQILAGVAVLT